MKCYKIVITGSAARAWAKERGLGGAGMVHDSTAAGTHEIALSSEFFKHSRTAIRSCIKQAATQAFKCMPVRAPVVLIWTTNHMLTAYIVRIAKEMSVIRGDITEADRFHKMISWVLDQTVSIQRRLKYDERTGTCTATRRLHGRNEVLRSPSIRKHARR